jgi:hypothetical protein
MRLMSTTNKNLSRDELALRLLTVHAGEKLGQEMWNMSASESWRGLWLRVADEAMRLLRPNEEP